VIDSVSCVTGTIFSFSERNLYELFTWADREQVGLPAACVLFETQTVDIILGLKLTGKIKS
jgi:hypothetical protein